MDYLFDVLLDDDLEFDDYNLALSSYPTWKSICREIKLNLLLEGGKKIQFDIDDIKHKYITLDDQTGYWRHNQQVSLEKVCCSVIGMTFILNGNKIEKLTLKTKILTTYTGEVVKSIVETGIEIKVSQFIYGKILNFIIETPKNIA
jgi:hypothetical protein